MHKLRDLLILLLIPMFCLAQNANKQKVGIKFLEENYEQLGLTYDDIKNIIVTDQYETKHSGVTHIYFTQAVDGIQVNNAILNVNIRKDNSIQHFGNRFVSDIKSKIASSKQNIQPEDAIASLAKDLGYGEIKRPLQQKAHSNGALIYTALDCSNDKIMAQPKYQKNDDGEFELCWEIFLFEKDNSDSWFAYVNAANGDVLNKRQNTIYCNHNHSKKSIVQHDCQHDHNKQVEAAAALGDGAQYLVVPFPGESPIHGEFEIVVDPSFEFASPFGWHDEDGVEGAEWTITRGNNVHAYEDQAAANASQGNEPDGGAELIFDWEYNESANPFENMEADVTGIFYACNMIHDLGFLAGLDEAAGAYQVNNYGNGGQGNDPVFGEALDGSGTNNANFAPSPDGFPGRMQMFRWEFSQGLFRVLSPSAIASDYATNEAVWLMTPEYATVDIEAEMIVARDNNPAAPTQGCGELVNDVTGKIALIYRGQCEFGLKAFNAEQAGAVAAIICNVPGADGPGTDGENAMGMAEGAVGNDVTIPVTAMAFSDCNRIQAELANGPVIGQLKILDTTGPTERSSGFDNGIIAHEIGHGISNRLVGGPNLAGCLSNGEQMGEGISDYMTLIFTVEPGDTGADPRGIGNFADGLAADGRGIRRFPYSTDFDICPLTYDDIKGQGVHATGEVWAATLWDIYWAFVDLYGWDADWTNPDSGNMRAIRLAFDGMKAAPCSPGFLDMRDAIFSVDNGEHECLLWEIFARRGLGYFADQGNPDANGDGVEDFEPLPTCIKELKIKKEIAGVVEAGDDLQVDFVVTNHLEETATNVIVTDILDEGLTVVPGSSEVDFTVDGQTVIFNLGDMPTLEERTFSYTLETDPTKKSTSILKNTLESDDEQKAWLPDISSEGFNFFQVSALDANSGEFSLFVSEVNEETDQRIFYNNLQVEGEFPVLRVAHRPNCTPGENGGWVLIKESNEDVAFALELDDFISGGYNNPISYGNKAIPNHQGWAGLNGEGEFQEMYIDMRKYIGKSVDVTFRFATYAYDGAPATFDFDNGWFLDDLELLDYEVYETEATVVADNSVEQTSGVKVTVINADGGSSAEDLSIEGVTVEVYPNPANDYVTLKLNSESAFNAQISINTIDGKMLSQQQKSINKAENIITFKTADLASGFYFLQIRNGERQITKKLMIE